MTVTTGSDETAGPTGGAWLMLAVTEGRQHGGNDGYDDLPARHYRWDSTVPNHAVPQAGDALAVWDKHVLLGASIIEQIEVGEADKRLLRCPHCGLAGIKARTGLSPRYKCYKCKGTFDVPVVRIETVTTYLTFHANAWTDLSGCLDAGQLRNLCVHPRSQLSLRPLNWTSFRAALTRGGLAQPLTAVDWAGTHIASGHGEALVRVRIGQAAFRRALLQKYGAACAFTGPAPLEALEAGHLYSYAATGLHHASGGLLLRRDIHRLFDSGRLAVNPRDDTIDVSPEVRAFPAYASLHGQPLNIKVEAGHRGWLLVHWKTHRS